MNNATLSIEARTADGKDRFRGREFRRILRMCLRYRRPLATGLFATVVFACLHTVSIGAAFPVFKILLEEEPIHVWVDRTVAGGRVGVAFAPVDEPDRVRIVEVDSDGIAHAAGIRPGDLLITTGDDPGEGVARALRELATAAPGQAIGVRIVGAGVSESSGVSAIALTPGEPDQAARLLQWAASFLPVDVEKDRLLALRRILLGLIGVIVLANVFRYIGEVSIAKAILRAMMDLRTRLYERTLRLPMSYFASQKTADVVGRFVQDIQEVQRGLLTLFSKFLREPLRALFLLGFAFALDWRLTLAVVMVAPVAVLLFWFVGRRVKRSNRKLLAAWGDMIGALTASLQSLRVVKIYTAEEREQQRLREVDSRALRQQIKLARLQALVSPVIETVAVLAGAVATLWLADRVLQRDLPISQFGTLGIALTMLFDPLRRLSDVYVRVQRSTAGAERIFQVIDHPIESDESDGDEQLAALERAIEYRSVTFTYPGAIVPALDRVDLTVERGETLAIVGPNGCGKTTLVSLLARLFTPNAGEILYDGVDLRRASLRSLRRRISLVTQDAIVFAGTAIENIAYGDPLPDVERAKHAAVRASADEFIEAIPGGYEAILGERGTTMSGGQRQRIAIARAIYRDAPILIFDEATSQIDSESEQKIQTALADFSRGRTTLIVAHRLSTIQFADRIVVMDAGRIVDTGTHADLFARCELYRTLCETQFVAQPTADAATDEAPPATTDRQTQENPSLL